MNFGLNGMEGHLLAAAMAAIYWRDLLQPSSAKHVELQEFHIDLPLFHGFADSS